MNKIFSIILKICILFFVGKCHAQLPILANAKIPESVAISTPDVMSFQKYGNIPTSLYNGKIDMLIPFHEIQVGKIKVPINLTYNSAGIKVDEIASQVGLGWNLNAGGNILLAVNDLQDGILTSQILGPIDFPVNVGYVRKYFLKNPQFNSNMEWFANVDSSPDFYYVNAPGLNNVFTIDDTDPNDYVTSNFRRKYISSFLYPKGHKISELKIENLGSFQGIGFTGDEDGNPDLNIPTKAADVNHTAYYTFKNFEITNEEGLVYTFSPGNFIENRILPVLVDPTEARLDPSYKLSLNTYNLTSIYDPSTKQKVQFIYETFQIAQPQRIKFLSKKNDIGNADACGFGFIPEYEGQSLYTNEQLVKYHTATRLQKITYNNGEVEFSYLNNRQDYDDKTLDLIKIKDIQSNIIKSYRLKYSYFDSKEACSQKECKRLKLDQIDEEYPTQTKLYYNFDYYYTNKLPKRFSYEQDFLGYYNNNGYQNTAAIGARESGPQPRLYFYPNKGEFSILPFEKKNDNNGRQITGDYSFEPNNYSLTGLLKKVTYETGGFTEFNYENHTFNFDGAEYIAGGARIESQTINDGNGNIRKIQYKYQEIGGKTSGYISSLPVFGYPNARIGNPNSSPNQWTPFSFTTYNFDKSGLELTRNNFVGYSRVEEIETGNGSTESLFYSPKDYPDKKSLKEYRDDCGRYLVENSAFPGKLYENLKERRGTLKLKKIVDVSGNKISEIENIYDYKVFSSIDVKYHEPYRITDNKFYPRIRGLNYYVSETSKINRERNLLSKVVSTKYFSSGNKITEEFFTYDPNYPFIKEQRTVDNIGELKANNYYPFDIQVSSQPYIYNLQTQNRLNEPIRQEIRKDNFLISTSQTNYKDFGNVMILPKSLLTAKENSPFEENTVVDLRDNNGNIIQYHDIYNVYTSFIWGYNKTQPIAKIENASYAQIATALGTDVTGLQNFNEINLTSINSLRNDLPNSMISTYTYKPLIGVSTITDPIGYKMSYEYDDFNRLIFIRDQNLNVLKRYCYNYKGQQINNCNPPTLVPTGLILTSANSSYLNFSWTAISGATGYKIYKNGVYVSSTTTNYGSLFGLSPLTTYGIQVLAYNSSGDGILCPSVPMSTTQVYTNMGTIYNYTGNTISAGIMQIIANNNTQCSIAMPSLQPGASFNFSTGYTVPISYNGSFVLKLYNPTVGITGNNYLKMDNGSLSTNGFFSNLGWGWEATVTSAGPQYTLNLSIK
jgi:hypothetical protein